MRRGHGSPRSCRYPSHDQSGPPCLPAHRPPFLRPPIGWFRRRHWHPTSAVVCSAASPRSPTPASGVADGINWLACSALRSARCWPARDPWPPSASGPTRRLRRGRLPGPYRQRPTGHGQPAHLAIGILRGHGDCNIAAACAATPATPPESCPCWASQAVKPNGPHDPAAVAGRHEHLMLVGRPTARRQEPRAARAAPNSRAQVGRPKAIGSNGPVRRSRLRL
jgi:hypothetical protein